MATGRLLMAFGVGLPAGLAAWLIAGPGPGAPGAGPLPPDAVSADPSRLEQGVEWFWALNGPVSADAGSDFSADALGNVFLAGGHGGLDMDNDGAVDLASGATAYVGANNPLFMKLSRRPSDDRMKIRWARSPKTPADRTQTKVAADGRGGVYVSGSFMESIAFEGGPVLQGAGGNDAYVARYDGDGSVVWAHVFGGPGGGDAIYGLASDSEANAYLVGTAGGTFPLDDRGGEFQTEAARAAAIVSYDPEGTVRWVRVFGPGTPLVFGVRVAPSGEVYVTGELEGAADFDDDGTDDLPAPKDRDGFVARFDRDGVFLGAWSVPTVTIATFTTDGDVILGGVMGGPMERRYGPVDFDGDGRPDIELKGGGPTGTWVARYSAQGERRWVRSYALQQAADLEVRGDIIALSGNYKGVRDLDEDGRAEQRLDVVDSSLETDLAIMLLSARDGRPQHLWIAPGPGNDWANAVVFLPNEPSLLVTGAIQLTADFTGDGENGEGWILCENLGDLFVAQYRLPELGTEGTEPSRAISLDATLAEREGRVEAKLAWAGVPGTQVDVYRNDVLITTVANDGSHTDVIPRNTVKPPFRYRVCAAGTGTCSATWQRRR